MRLHRLALTDVAGVGASELTIPDEGVSVVLAPNEAGKSTLLRAYRLLLDPRVGHNGKGAEVKSLQPIGRDIGSTIEAELSMDGERFEVARTYNRNVASSLTVHSKVTTVKTGKEADDLLRSRFLATVDQNLFELLTFEQGRMLNPLAGGDSTTVNDALRAHAAVESAGPGGDSILAALEKRVRAAFHARTGAPIKDLLKLRKEVEDHEQRRDELAQRIAALAGPDDDERRTTEIDEVVRDLRTVTARIERAGLAAQVETARKLLEAATQAVTQRQKQVEQLERAIAEEKELGEKVGATKQEEKAALKRVGELEKQHERSAKERAALLKAAAQAESDLIAGIESSIRKLSTALGKEKVDEKLVKRARQLDREIAVSAGSLEGGAWELVAKAGRPLSLEVDGQTVTVKKGGRLTRAVSASLVLSDADGTVLDLHADASRRKAVEKHAKATAALAELLAQVGVPDLAALEERLEAREETAERLEELEQAVEDLRDDPVADRLPSPSKRTGQDVESLEEAHGLALERLDEAGEADERELVAARAAHAQATQLVEQQEQELGRSRERRVEAEKIVTAARRSRSDADLTADVTAATAALQKLGDVDEPEDAETLTKLREQLTERMEGLRREQHVAEGRRSSTGALTATLENLTETAAALRTQYERDLREARAAQDLLTELESERRDQGERYRGPLEQRIGELLTRVCGHDCRVELDDDLRIIQRSDAEGRMIPWAQLSGGAKEQGAIVTGLAIAELAGDGGVPFWIDDAIVFTDDGRVEALKSILAETTAQVIVLTCRSELADGLPQAAYVSSR